MMERKATASPANVPDPSPSLSSLIPQPHSSSLYCGRWRHRDKLVFRVWPKYKETHAAIMRLKEIPIDGFIVTPDGRTEARYHSKTVKSCAFELRDEDVDTLAAASAAGAHLRLDEMVVHAPGTADEKAKKECWLEIPFDANPNVPCRTGQYGVRKSGQTPKLRCITATDIEAELRAEGYAFDGIVLVESEDDIDEDAICRKAVEDNAVIVFSAGGVLGTRARKILARARYWVVPGRRPDEEGGLFRGYQFCDRFVRWHYRIADGERTARHAEHMEKMHESVREQGRKTRRVYFTDQVVNRFAERLGVSRQRVASRFLDDGVFDWLVRSADAVKPKTRRDTKLTMTPLANRAVDAIEFFYRATGRMEN